MMKFRALGTIALASMIFGIVSRADAAVPATITEQGRVFDQLGNPLNGPYLVKFAIYSAATGGTALWNETQTLQIDTGNLTTQLGSVTPFPGTLFDGTTLYLGVALGNDAEMVPRQIVSSVPYAEHAASADTATLATNATNATNATSAVYATGDITPTSVTSNSINLYKEDSSLLIGCGANNCWTNANGVIGFPGSNVQHGQIAFYPGIGFRFINSSPAGPGDDYGAAPNHIAVYAASFNTVSSRSYKNDIHYLDGKEHDRMLTTLNDLKIANYQLKGDIDPKQRHIGFIAEELPKDVLSKDGKSVDVYELLTFTVGAMKAQQARIDTLESQIRGLEKQLGRRR